jgi:hypothetical protein
MSLMKTALRISMILFLAALIFAIGGVLYLAERGTIDMKQGAFASDTANSIPLIDTQIPKQLATATFAMG